MSASLLSFDIATVVALCFVAWGFFFGVLRRFGIEYAHRFLFTTLYFSAFAIGTAAVFWDFLAPFVTPIAPLPLAALAAFMLVQAIWYAYFPRLAPRPSEYLAAHPARNFLEIDPRRLVSKSTDILAQQVFIVLLVVFLRDFGLSLPQLWLAFGAIFLLIHMPLIGSEWGSWPAWLFGAAAAVFSVVFPTLILLVPYGFCYNLILHWIFYSGTASAFWLARARRA